MLWGLNYKVGYDQAFKLLSVKHTSKADQSNTAKTWKTILTSKPQLTMGKGEHSGPKNVDGILKKMLMDNKLS